MRGRLFLLLALAACGRANGDPGEAKSSPLLHAQTGETERVDPAVAAKDPEALARAVSAPWRDTARKLGAHSFKGTHKVRVVENGKEVEALDEESTIAFTAAGELHALYTNSKDYGRDVFFAKGTVWVRPRYGKFHRRPATTEQEPWQVADEIYGTLGADFALCAFSAAGQDGGEVTAAGRKARKITLTLAAPRKKEKEPRAQRQWRDAVTVQALSGEVIVDVETGAILSAHLAAKVSFQQSGRPLEMSFEVDHAITDVGGAVAVTLPADADSVDTPLRAHEFEERQELLEGLAPPPHKAPVPGEERSK